MADSLLMMMSPPRHVRLDATEVPAAFWNTFEPDDFATLVTTGGRLTFAERETLWRLMNKSDDVPREINVILPAPLRDELTTVDHRLWALLALREGALTPTPLPPLGKVRHDEEVA